MVNLGSRIKRYEQANENTLLPNAWIVARLDGRSFSKFTKAMKFEKPFDLTYLGAMRETTKQIMKTTHAALGFTQSDEVTLLFSPARERFSNRAQKLTSTLAGEFSSRFLLTLLKAGVNVPDNLVPHFDCRVFAVPSVQEALNAVLWREQDAVKNSILSVAQAHFTKKEMFKQNTKQLVTKLEQEKGVYWDRLDMSLKRGCYLVPKTKEVEIDDETWAKIPDDKKPENKIALRSVILQDDDFLSLSKLDDPVTYFGLK